MSIDYAKSLKRLRGQLTAAGRNANYLAAHAIASKALAYVDDLLPKLEAEQQAHAETKRQLTIATEALENIASGSPVQCLIARLGEGTIECGVGEKACAACRAARLVEGAKRELEQAEVRLAGCGVAALGWNDNPAKPGDYGYSASYGDVLRVRAVVDAVLEREKQLSACVLGCPWDEHPRRHRDDCPLVVHGFRETHVPQPPLPACKRCGKPVAHPAQEYCGAACSAQRNRPVEDGEGERCAYCDDGWNLGGNGPTSCPRCGR